MAKDFESILREIGDADQPLTAEVIYGLSDLDADKSSGLLKIWGAIPVERRRQLMQRLTEVSETNFEMDFTAVTRIALTDLDNELREAAIEASWIDDSPDLLRRLMTMASSDLSEQVRAAAASAMGRFILMGELGEFSADLSRQAENVALKLYKDEREPIEVRRRALEAVANCSRDGISEMIEQAYHAADDRMRLSAIFAMGRSCDAKWSPVVLHELVSEDPEMRFEAARTAGELELRESVPLLADILLEEDREIMQMAVWALGEIGGDKARRLLEDMMERADRDGDDDLADAVEEALEVANLVGEDLNFDD